MSFWEDGIHLFIRSLIRCILPHERHFVAENLEELHLYYFLAASETIFCIDTHHIATTYTLESLVLKV